MRADTVPLVVEDMAVVDVAEPLETEITERPPVVDSVVTVEEAMAVVDIAMDLVVDTAAAAAADMAVVVVDTMTTAVHPSTAVVEAAVSPPTVGGKSFSTI